VLKVKADTRVSKKFESGWLSHLPQDLADALVSEGRTRKYTAGDTVYAVGQEQQSLFGIQSGVVRMLISVNDHPLHFAHVTGPGFWFGEFEFIMPQPRVMEMVAAEQLILTEITREAFDKIAVGDPRAWQAVAILAGLNQAIALGAADDLLVKDSMQRLVSVLLRLAGYRNGFQGNPPIDKVPVTQRELADASCLSLSKTAALLSELADQGGVTTDYRSIRILDVSLLYELLV
jgi:CRP/FNR family cyclic AMP-dependent transcriptional regulator